MIAGQMTIDDGDQGAGFIVWLANAKRGDRREYYRGFLAPDCENISKQLRQRHQPLESPLLSVRNTVWRAYERGAVALTQKKHQADDYSYYATVL